MDVLLKEFQDDLARVRKLLEFTKILQALTGIAPPADLQDCDFTKAVCQIHLKATESHGDLKILIGTMVLYLGGRFEYFVREEFEDLCEGLAKKCNSYDGLPKEMRANLITMTAEVMANPRKFGHADKGVEAFIKNLAANLSDRGKIDSINTSCLSITYENMRPDTLQELFERIGAKDIWKSIAEQGPVKVFFETNDSGQAKTEARSSLNKFMDVRNTIAHPSAGITWPELQVVEEYIKMFEALSEAISLVAQVLTVSLVSKSGGTSVAVTVDPSRNGNAPAVEMVVQKL